MSAGARVASYLAGDGALLSREVVYLDGMVTFLIIDGSSLANDNNPLARGNPRLSSGSRAGSGMGSGVLFGPAKGVQI